MKGEGMTKKEFIKKVPTMEHPIMEFFTGSFEFLSMCCVVWDRDNVGNKFMAQTVRMSWREWNSGRHDNYFNRERVMRRKLRKWLYDSCGNNCTVRPS